MTNWIETYFVPLLIVGAMIVGACAPVERPRAPYQVGEIVCVKLTSALL